MLVSTLGHFKWLFFSNCVYLLAAKIHVLVNYRSILVLIICISWMFLEVTRSDLAWENIFDVNFHRFSFTTLFWSLYKRQTFPTMQSFSNCAIPFSTLFSTLTGS